MNSADTNVMRTMSKGSAARLTNRRLAWITHLIVLAALVALLSWFNEQTIENAVQVWWVSPTYSHCFLIIPVSAYLVWRRRRQLAMAVPAVYPIALVLLPPLIVFSIVGNLADINEFEQLAFIAIVQVMILTLLGPIIYRNILFPALFLFFLVPMGDYLVGPLQQFTSQFISAGLTILGIPHFTDENIVKLSNGVFEVAEACAGLRFLIATLAIGVLFVYLTYRKWYKAVLFLVACFVLPVVANGFRALGIVLIAHWSDNRIAVGFDHIVYGWGFLVAVLLVLMLIGGRFADPVLKEEPLQATAEARVRPISLVVTVGLSILAVCIGPGFLHWRLTGPSDFNASMFSAPLMLHGWQQGPISSGWSPRYSLADARMAFAMHEQNSSPLDVDVFVNYYAGKNGSHILLKPQNKMWAEDLWHSVSDGSANTAVGRRAVAVRESVISSGGLVRIVWWTYWNAGRFTPSARVLKLESLRDVFSGKGGAALIALSTPAEGNLAESRGRLGRAFEALGEITTRLKRASGN
jgi:exosortase A